MPGKGLRWIRLVIGIVPVIVGFASCPLIYFLGLPSTGTLKIEIDYDAGFYTETFAYSRQADNIRHYVLVMPQAQAERVGSHEIFLSLAFPAEPDAPPTLRDERGDLAWALSYLHEAPAGYFQGQFEPGRYAVAVAFIAAPLSREDAGYGADVLLYPGITGGGASTDYQEIEIEAGGLVSLLFTLTDNNGWACPWLSVYDGHSFERRTEILRNLRGQANERSEISPLGPFQAVDGMLTLRISEERDEVSFIDEFYLLMDGVKVAAQGGPAAALVEAADRGYLILNRGDAIDFSFRLPDTVPGAAQPEALVVVTGYYETQRE